MSVEQYRTSGQISLVLCEIKPAV
uniref:Uncharacterized protein n=1 Tax=Anguilla anguilla TaxID=7936 RepID=A0A0E9RK36_ANGAN